MANINVSFQDMNDAASRLQVGQEDMTTRLNDLKIFIGSLVDGGFVTDQASVAFREQYEKFTTGATQAVSGLEGLSSFLKQAATSLGDADASLATAIRG